MYTHMYIYTGTGDRFNGVDEELMRDLRQVFSRGQDGKYDGNIYRYIYRC
jgi:hypothetical protein